MSAMPVNISGSVGRGGVNKRDDVLKVQQLINTKLPIPLLPLNENGVCDPLTINAIEEIQRRNLKMPQPDGRVDPNGATFGFLTGRSPGTASTSGRKYTNNPNEVVTKQTKPSARDVVNMLLAAWPQLAERGARTLTAQFMFETGEGQYCFNWNLGNVKSSGNDKHMYLRDVWECFASSAAQQAVDSSNGLAHLATAEEIRKHGWKCGARVTVVFEPPHYQCRFRAYDSLSEGADRWVKHHQSIAKSKPDYLANLNAGNIDAVAQTLADVKYYTGNEADYAKGMKGKKEKIDRALGAL